MLVMTGANSAVGLRSMPVRYLFLDEVDGYAMAGVTKVKSASRCPRPKFVRWRGRFRPNFNSLGRRGSGCDNMPLT